MSNKYLLTESLIGSVSIYMITKRLMTDFKDWDAYKLGIIDSNGNKLKAPVTFQERQSWDILTRFCCNIKKIATKFMGKSKFAAYFTAAYLLKDSINYYVKYNHERLDETLLEDMCYATQNKLNNAIKNLPEHDFVTEENLEVMMFKHYKAVATFLSENQEICDIFEEDAGGINTGGASPSVAADVAQHGQYMGVQQRPEGPKVKTKKKKKKKVRNLDLSGVIKSRKVNK